jgi:hypothetical protein
LESTQDQESSSSEEEILKQVDLVPEGSSSVLHYSINYTPSREEENDKTRTGSLIMSSYIVTMRGAGVEYYGQPEYSSGT